MEIFNVISHLHPQFNDGGPCFTVEKFGLHSSYERFDHGIVIAITDRSKSESESESVITHVARESPGCKLTRLNRSLQHGPFGVRVSALRIPLRESSIRVFCVACC